MSQTNQSGEEGVQGDPVSEEFDFYFPFAKTLALDLNTPEDTSIAAAWVQKLETEPESEEEKRTRLNYLKLLLFVLQRGRLSGIFKKQPPSGALQPFPQGMSIMDMGNLMLDQDDTPSFGGGDARCLPYNIEISNDLREFVASQEIPNFGVQMYYAWSSEEPIHKWLSFDEEKFPQFVLDKIKQLKEVRSDEKSSISKGGCLTTRKGCDIPLIERSSKKRVKTPQEIERSQGRSYHTYMGLVGRMGNFDKCDDDPEKGQRQDQRRGKCPSKRNGQKRCNGNGEAEDMQGDEEMKNFLSGFGGVNAVNRPCYCQPMDIGAKGGPQPFESQQAPGRNYQYYARPEPDNVQWASPGNRCSGQRRVVEDADQPGCNQQMQQQPAQLCSRRTPSPRSKSNSPNRMTESPRQCPPPSQCPPQDNPRDFCTDEPVCICSSPPCTCPCPRAQSGPNGGAECGSEGMETRRKPSPERLQMDQCQQGYSNRRSLGDQSVGVIQGTVMGCGTPGRGNMQGNEGRMNQRQKQPEIIHCYDATNPDPDLIQAMGSYWEELNDNNGFPNICSKSRPPADKPSQNTFQQKTYASVRKDLFDVQQQQNICTQPPPEPVCPQTPVSSRKEQRQDVYTPASVGQTLYPAPQPRSPRTPSPQGQPCALPQEQQQCMRPNQQINFAPQQYQQDYQGPTQDAQMLGDFDDVCGRPQVASGRPQDVCGRPQDVSVRSQNVCGRPQDVCGRPQDVCGRQQDVSVRSQNVCGRPQDVSGRSQNVCARPQDVSGRSQNVCARPQDVSGRSQNVCGRPQDVSTRSQNVCGRPQSMSGRPQDVCGRPQVASARPQDVCGRPQDVSGRSQDVCGRPQNMSGRPQDVCGRPQDVCGRPQDISERPQDVCQRPQDVCQRPQSTCKSPQSNRPQNMVSCSSSFAMNNNAGRLSNMLQGIKQKTEAHREKCDQGGSRKAAINEAAFCQQPQANVCPEQPPNGGMFAGPFGGEAMGLRTPVCDQQKRMKRPMTQPHVGGMGKYQGNLPDRGFVSFTGQFCTDDTQYMDLPLTNRSPTKPCQPTSNKSLDTCDASVEDEDECESSESGDVCPAEPVQKYEMQTCPQPKSPGRPPQQPPPCVVVEDMQTSMSGRPKANNTCPKQWAEPSCRFIQDQGGRLDVRPNMDMQTCPKPSPGKSPKQDPCGYRDGGDVQCIMPKRISPGKTCPPQEPETRPCPKFSPGKSPVPQDQLPIAWAELPSSTSPGKSPVPQDQLPIAWAELPSTPSPGKFPWAKDGPQQAHSPRKQSPPKAQPIPQEQYNEDYDDMPSSASALARQMGYQANTCKTSPRKMSPGKMPSNQAYQEDYDDMPTSASAMNRKSYQNDPRTKPQMQPGSPRKKSPAKIIPTIKTEPNEWLDMESNMTQMSCNSGRSPKKDSRSSGGKGGDIQACPTQAMPGKPIQQMQPANEEWDEAADFTTTTSSGRNDTKRSDLTPTVFPLQYITEEGELTTDPFKNRPKEPQPGPAESCPPQRPQGMPQIKQEVDKTYMVPPGSSKQPRTQSSQSVFSQQKLSPSENENIVNPRQNESNVGFRQSQSNVGRGQSQRNLVYRQSQGKVGRGPSQRNVGYRQSRGSVGRGPSQRNVGYRQSQGNVSYRQSQRNINYRQSQSNVGFRQSQKNIGYRQSQSNVGRGQPQSNVGYRQSQSTVGYRPSQSNAGYGQNQGNVARRRSQSAVSYSRSKVALKSARSPSRPELRVDTNSKTMFKSTTRVKSNTACNEMGINMRTKPKVQVPIRFLPKILIDISGVTPLRGQSRTSQQVPCYTPSQMAEFKTCVQLMQESSFPSCEGNPYADNSMVFHRNPTQLVKISSPKKWQGSFSQETVPDISSIHLFDTCDANNPNAPMPMQPCDNAEEDNAEFMPFCSMNADCGASKFFNVPENNQDGECPQPQGSATTGCSYQDGDSEDDEDTPAGFYPC